MCNLNMDGGWIDENGKALEENSSKCNLTMSRRQKPALVGGRSGSSVKRRKSVRFRKNSENGTKNGVANGTNGSVNGSCSDDNEEYSNDQVTRGSNGQRIISLHDHKQFAGSEVESERPGAGFEGKIFSVRDPEELFEEQEVFSELGEEQEVRIKVGEVARLVSKRSRKSSSDCFVRSELKWVFLKNKPKVPDHLIIFKIQNCSIRSEKRHYASWVLFYVNQHYNVAETSIGNMEHFLCFSKSKHNNLTLLFASFTFLISPPPPSSSSSSFSSFPSSPIHHQILLIIIMIMVFAFLLSCPCYPACARLTPALNIQCSPLQPS